MDAQWIQQYLDLYAFLWPRGFVKERDVVLFRGNEERLGKRNRKRFAEAMDEIRHKPYLSLEDDEVNDYLVATKRPRLSEPEIPELKPSRNPSLMSASAGDQVRSSSY
jgi:hypothetical protein